MIEPVQILLFSVIVILTVLVVIIGLQIYYILFEIRKMMSKFNSMADEAVHVTGTIGKSFQSINGFSEGLRTIFGFVFKRKGKKEQEDEKDD